MARVSPRFDTRPGRWPRPTRVDRARPTRVRGSKGMIRADTDAAQGGPRRAAKRVSGVCLEDGPRVFSRGVVRASLAPGAGVSPVHGGPDGTTIAVRLSEQTGG